MTAALSAFLVWAIGYVATAAGWGLVVGGVLSGPLWMLGLRRAIPFVLAAAFVVFLALLPLPGPDFDCATTLARPILRPFQGIGEVFRTVAETGQPWRLLTDKLFVSSIMNVVFFMLPGAALVLLIGRTATAVASGLALSVAIEVTQLTGTFGLYDCAYRFADVTDLMTNTLGVTLGFLLARRMQPAA